MPTLKSNEDHKCPACMYAARRARLKTHLNKANNDGTPKCPGLKKVIPSDVWENQILQFYTNDAPRPDLNQFMRKSPKGQRKRKPIQQLPKCNVRKRLKRDGLIATTGECKYSKGELMEMLFMQCDNDERWLLNAWKNRGAILKIPIREALELKIFSGLTRRGYQLFRSKLRHSLPARNKLDALAKTLVPENIIADQTGARARYLK